MAGSFPSLGPPLRQPRPAFGELEESSSKVERRDFERDFEHVVREFLAPSPRREQTDLAVGFHHGLLGHLITLTTQLPVAQRHRVLDALIRSLGLSDCPLGIEKTEGVAGGEACVVRTRIAVWMLQSYRLQDWTDDQILANYPTLRRGDLAAAWLYVRAFPAEIEKAIEANEDD